jgi:hypothetical protein
MSIDGIGKPGLGQPANGIGELGKATGVGGASGESFKVATGEPAGSVGLSEALQRLEHNQITLDEYLDMRVHGAVEHLEGKLSVEQLEFVKETLREQLRSDPVLIELVRRATGTLPSDTR